MAAAISPRLLAVADALPLKPGLRVLEIGCGPGVLAREIARRIAPGGVVAIDRSAAAIAQAIAGSAAEIAAGQIEYRQASAEGFRLADGEPRFDLAVAIRVGALDGRHPQLEARALAAIAGALGPEGRLFIDGGTPLRELPLPR